MRKPEALIGSGIHLAVAPGVVAGLVPWMLTGWQATEPAPVVVMRIAGAILVGAGVLALLSAFVRFVASAGTPAPVAPTERLVATGLYGRVRNPMYLAVVGVIAGQALVLGRPALLSYALLVAVVQAAFVRWYEEPALARRFGAEYESYRDTVPAWLPRLSRQPRSAQRG